MSRLTRWGFVSTARINLLVLNGVRGSDEVVLAAVASRDRARAEAYAREHGFERAHGSYEELLADPGVDAVYLPLPNALHVDWTLRALEAGKHVLCEKPLTPSPEEAEHVFDAAEAAGLVVMEAFMYRHHPQTRRVAELVGSGAIGELRLISSAFSFLLTREVDVRLDPELLGGSLLDVGCYCVSMSRLLAGEPEAVHGEQVVGPTGVDVRFAGTLRFPGDVLAHFDCGMDIPSRSALEVVGAEGSLFVADPWHARRPGIELRGEAGDVERIEIPDENRYRLQLEHFGAVIRGEADPRLGRADAVGQARALDALLRSARERGPVSLTA